MIGQTIAIFVDAYRDLNSRKLFWITLILSTVFISACAIVGVDEHGLKIARSHIDMPPTQALYFFKYYVFRVLIIGLWLTWVATILAIVSTAGIFPDLITGGSIDLYLSKPISRARLFLTKYLAGLIFVLLQVIVVTVGGFLILGWRGHEWLPKLFLSIPIVICFFSYLFGICVFFGVLTRSTIAALLLTIGAWGMLAAVDWVEPWLLGGHEAMVREADRWDASAREASADDPGSAMAATDREQAASTRTIAARIDIAHRIVYGIKTITPKTTDTIELLNRYVFTDEEVASSMNQARRGYANPPADGSHDADLTPDDRPGVEGAKETARSIRSRSITWVVGTSLLFEAVLVSWAGWIFCRRDY